LDVKATSFRIPNWRKYRIPVVEWAGKGLFMASKPDTDKQHAHELIERLSPGQVKAVARLLEEMLDPVSRAIANAPVDDEPETRQERQAVAESKKWFEQHSGKGTSHEEVLADFNLTSGDFKKHKA